MSRRPNPPKQYDPSNPSNPFKRIRENQKLSQAQLADKIGCTKHAILRLEQGMFTTPLPVVLEFFADNYHVPKLALLQQYEEFQIHTRATNGKLLGEFVIDLLHWNYDHGNPLDYLLKVHGYNPTSFAKALCINQKVVSMFLQGTPVGKITVPEQITSSLRDAGYSEDDTEMLCRKYKTYRDLYLKLKNERESNMHSRPEPNKLKVKSW